MSFNGINELATLSDNVHSGPFNWISVFKLPFFGESKYQLLPIKNLSLVIRISWSTRCIFRIFEVFKGLMVFISVSFQPNSLYSDYPKYFPET